MPALLAKDIEDLPPTVSGPLTQLLDYGLWFAELVCLCWLIVAACRYFALRHSTVETFAEAHNAVARSLIAAVLANASMPIAIEVLQTR
ncbi:hypothetical protein [Nocardia sp. NBC_01327]|uniref:hypothetical protein n=1 Tax=Nocardia sp. NBC_01327 TaxID=2903593 RepID=UPI002E110B79|nr:hypothetical protein OG326_42555 [Nocardia sp. NBC_01327]